jgi:hypothetical protein
VLFAIQEQIGRVCGEPARRVPGDSVFTSFPWAIQKLQIDCRLLSRYPTSYPHDCIKRRAICCHDASGISLQHLPHSHIISLAYTSQVAGSTPVLLMMWTRENAKTLLSKQHHGHLKKPWEFVNSICLHSYPPTETLLRLLLPLNDRVWRNFRP